MQEQGRRGQPLRLSFVSCCVVPDDVQAGHIRQNAHIPFLEPQEPHSRKLAIVGGGPSVLAMLDELRAFDGDIWAINYTAAWLAGHGIESTMLTVDGQRFDARVSEGVKDAIVASCVHPDTAGYFESVRQFHLAEHTPDGIQGGTTTACRAEFLSVRQGYCDVTLYGCESSFGERDHVDRSEASKWREQIIVHADGRKFRTTPQLMMQADDLSAFIVGFPEIFKERSGGLLRAMVNDPWWEVVAVSDAMKAHLIEINGSTPFMEPYAEHVE